jgi:hypothetical protein
MSTNVLSEPYKMIIHQIDVKDVFLNILDKQEGRYKRVSLKSGDHFNYYVKNQSYFHVKIYKK